MPRTLWFLSFIALFISASSAEAQPNVFPPAADSQFPIEVRRAAWEFALTSSPNATAEEILGIYQRVLSSLLPPQAVLARAGQTEGEEPLEQDVPAEFEDDAIIEKIENDPTFLKNIERMEAEAPGAIILGHGVETSEFREVVFVRSVSLNSSGSACVCTGSLISPDVVITARHCLFSCQRGRENQPIQVREVRIGSHSQNGEVYKVKAQAEHPSADIAILVLEKPVPPSVARPVKIATPDQIRSAYRGRIVGFGVTETGQSGIKMMGDVPFIRTECQAGEFGCRGNEMVAGGGETDTCLGDSGGPIFIPVGDQYVLAGVTSRAIARSGTINIRGQDYPCGFGGIYVNVPAYLTSFIEPKIKDLGGQPIGMVVPPPTLKPKVVKALEQLKAGIEKLEATLRP